MYPLAKYLFYTSVSLILAVAVSMLLFNHPEIWHPAAVILTVVLAIGSRFVPKLRGYQFTAWIIAAVTAAMMYPAAFLRWGSLDLREKWLILGVVQIVMFGMGTQMSLEDFTGVARSPRGVLVGIVCHF